MRLIDTQRLNDLRKITSEDYYNDDLEKEVGEIIKSYTAYDVIVSFQKSVEIIKSHTDSTPQSIKEDWINRRNLLWVGVAMIDEYYAAKPKQGLAALMKYNDDKPLYRR